MALKDLLDFLGGDGGGGHRTGFVLKLSYKDRIDILKE